MLAMLLGSAVLAAPSEGPEIAFDIWDWTAPAQSVETFDRWAADLAETGITRIELSVPWNLLEPEPGVYDLTWLEERLAIARRHGLGLLLRINSYYGGCTPAWYEGDRWRAPEGAPEAPPIPSFMDPRFWDHYGGMCTRIAALCRGGDVAYNAFIGVHAELKWSEWWSYDPSTLAVWREALRKKPRPAWLRDVAGDAELPKTPPAPGPTDGVADTDPVNRAWIAFRERCWREAMDRFAEVLRAGDPDAIISSPLGESYRKESASMSNLDYWGLTRQADYIVHSYDFFWHHNDGAWQAAAAVDSFRGITGRPVLIEFDGLDSLINTHGYTPAHLLAIGREAAAVGAGLKLANNSYADVLPSQRPELRELVALWKSDLPRAAADPAADLSPADTVLLFVSKWANYSYREPTQWLHEAQFGAYKLFRDLGIPVRVICEDNLEEDLSGYRLIYCSFSPRTLLPESARRRLEALDLPLIEDTPSVPARYEGEEPLTAEGIARAAVTASGCPAAPQDLSSLGEDYGFGLKVGDQSLAAHKPGHVALGYPLGYLYLHDTAPQQHAGVLAWALLRALEKEPR